MVMPGRVMCEISGTPREVEDEAGGVVAVVLAGEKREAAETVLPVLVRARFAGCGVAVRG